MVQIDNEDLKQVRSEFLDTAKYRNTQNAVMKNGIKKSITNQSSNFLFGEKRWVLIKEK